MISLIAIGTDQLAAAAKPLIAVSFRAKSVEVRLLALIDRDAIDPKPPPRDPLLDHIIGLCKQCLDLVTSGGAE